MIIVCIHMSQGYILTSIKHCIPQIILLAAGDLNLRGQMSLQKQYSVVSKQNTNLTSTRLFRSVTFYLNRKLRWFASFY